MSLQQALSFIDRYRKSLEPEAAEEIGLDPAGNLQELLDLANTWGFRFSVDQLRQAHRIDWQMRSLKHF